MASMATEQAPARNTTSAPSAPRGGRNRRGRSEGGSSRGGRGGRGRGRGREGDDSAAVPGGERGGRRRWGIGRGGEGKSQADAAQDVNAAQAVLRMAPVTPVKGDGDDAESNPDTAICFICADPVKYNAVPPCNHTTCHICSLRLRALYKSKMCAHCRVCAPVFDAHACMVTNDRRRNPNS
jgi:hypothetical protein